MLGSVVAAACAIVALCSFNFIAAISSDVTSACSPPTTIGFHAAVCTPDGNIALPLAFSSLEDALSRAVSWYQKSPLNEHGFPPVVRLALSCHITSCLCVDDQFFRLQVHSTFVDGNFTSSGVTIDAAMQNGMGLLSYVKLYQRSNSSEHLNFAKHFARYLIEVSTSCHNHLGLLPRSRSRSLSHPPLAPPSVFQASLTTNFSSHDSWPLVPRSTGIRLEFPLKCASSYDLLFGCHTIEPDKVAIAAYALLRYHQVTGDKSALDVAVHSAAVLAAAQIDGNTSHAPWAFRVNAADARAVNGFKNGDSAFPLRLFSTLVQAGYSEFAPNLSRLWAWVLRVQLESLNAANHSSHDYGDQFVNFHEDIAADHDQNRNSWTALELARFLIESRATGIMPDWRLRVQQLIDYSLQLFSHSQIGNTTIMGEQDRLEVQGLNVGLIVKLCAGITRLGAVQIQSWVRSRSCSPARASARTIKWASTMRCGWRISSMRQMDVPQQRASQ
jgi:hypothetical protein